MFDIETLALRAGEISEDEDLIWELTHSGLDSIEAEDSPDHLVTRLLSESTLVSHFQARMYATIAEIADLEGFDPEGLPAEVTVALRLTRAAGDAEYGLALLLDRFPSVRDALSTGSIDLRRARVIVEALASMADEGAVTILNRILPYAGDLTTGQLRARIHRLKLESDSESVSKEFHEGLERRRVVVESNPDGTANLLALNLAPDAVMAIRARLNAFARRAATKPDARTADQRRADVFCDLLTGRGSGSGNEATVDISVELTTLMGLDERPGAIPGYGPVIADIARRVVQQQTTSHWEYTVTDQGRPIATGTIARRPTAGMRRHLRSRHQTCVFPGCRMPASSSDLDHWQPWADSGATALDNLTPLCRHHHGLKDHGWSYNLEVDNTVTWTSPLGRMYATGSDPPI